MKPYRPLPDCLTIKNSDIEGLGLFATKDIPKGTNLGLSHISPEHVEWYRTPLGGFYNHSDTPNCIKEIKDLKTGLYAYIVTLKNIKAGEEITVKYTFSEYKDHNY